MPQIGGKNAKKSSKTKSKSSSTSKRHFTVVIGTKEHGLYVSSSPSSAARKVVSKLCGKEKGKKVEFCLREITQGSKKKTYGPYLGHIEKLAKPIELKGRVIERKPVALLKPKSSAKKGGMRGGGIGDDFISEFDKSILSKPSRNNSDYTPGNNKLSMDKLRKKYVGFGLSVDTQKDILLRSLKSKFNNIEFGNTPAVDLLFAKYKNMGIDLTHNMLHNLVKTHTRGKKS